MENKDINFLEFKKQTLSKLENALQKHNVDQLVIPVLSLINEQPQYISTSSCAGRIIVMQLPKVGDKKQAIFHGKWHRPVELNEVISAIKKYESDQLWFIAQAPIFHIAAESVNDADRLLKIGVSSGFKHSGFKTIKDRIIVELISTERMDVPIGRNGEALVSNEYIQQLILYANDLISRCQKKLYRLEKNMKNKIR